MISIRSKICGTVNPVPDQSVRRELKSRCRRLVNTDGLSPLWVDVNL